MSRIIKAQEIQVNPGLIASAALETLDATLARPASGDEEGNRAAAEEPTPSPRSLVERAEEEARARLAEAERESARIREEAYAAGYEDGKAAGMSKVLEDARVFLEYLEDLARAVAEATASAVKTAEETVAHLAIEVAGRILRHEVSVDGSIVLEMVRESLQKANAKGPVRLRVSAWDLDRVRDFREDLLRLADDVTGIEIVEDPRVEPGGCIVETDFGCVDARLASQLREVGRAFFGNGHGHGHGGTL
ncbi:MAG: FliH/SctL family protein [Bacillota bacterium]